MRRYKKTHSSSKRIFRRSVIAIAILAILGWMIGFNKIKEKWDFLWRGGGSTKKLEQFYDAATRQDSSMFLNLFSEKTLQQEGRQNILTAFEWATSDSYVNKEFKTEISRKRMSGDTAVIDLEVRRNRFDAGQNATFYLLKENGDWKIIFAK